jgi:hypothetical protein
VIPRAQSVEAPSTGDPRRTRLPALPWGDALILGLGLWFVLAYLMVAVIRLRYPFEIEWMEGAVVDHVRRIMTGHVLYVPPTLRFVPFVYPPVYFYLGALVSTAFGAGLFPLRLLSMAASLGCFALIFAFVRRESGHARSAFVAVAFFAACYPLSGGWYDLARIDSVFLCLLLGGSYLLRFHATTRGWAAAALLLVLAFFTKQSAIVVAAPLLCYAVWLAPRRGLLLAIGSLLAAAGAIWLLDRSHGGWYSYYVFRMPARIQQTDAVAAPFWSHDLLPPVAIACALGVSALLPEAHVPRGRTLFYSLLSSGLVGCAWLSRLHAGAYQNVLIPAHAAIGILFGLFLARSRGREAEPVRPGASLPRHVCVLVLVQFGLLLADPRRQLPSARDVEMGRQLVARLASVPGEVWLPQHGYLGSLAGKRTYAHAMAVYDVIRAGDAADRDHLLTEVRQALAARQFDLVIVDRAGWMRADLEHWYKPAGPAFPSAAGFWTLTGMRLRPETVYTPRRPDAFAGP